MAREVDRRPLNTTRLSVYASSINYRDGMMDRSDDKSDSHDRYGNEGEKELRGANWRRGFIEGVTNYSLFPVPEPGTIEFRARERNRATVSRSRGDFSPFFFPFSLSLFLPLPLIHPRRTAYKRTPPSVQVYVGPRCTLSGMKREKIREEKRGNKIKRSVQRNFLMLLRPL